MGRRRCAGSKCYGQKKYERMTREIERTLHEADYPNGKLYTQEEVIRVMQERIDRALDKPC